MKNEKGITLVALILTVVILLILAGVGATTGINQLNNIKLKSFYSKLEIAQEAVEKISSTNESYINSSGNKTYIRDSGAEPTEGQIEIIKTALNINNINGYNFKYFTAAEVESILNVSGVDMNLLIDFDKNIVISADGEEVDGKMYYVLKNKKYTVEYQDKNTGNVDFTCTVKNYGLNTYKITVTPINVGNIKEGTVKYRYSDIDDYWKLAKNNEIIVNKLATYDIMYTDVNNNSVTKSIKIEKNEYENVIIVE